MTQHWTVDDFTKELHHLGKVFHLCATILDSLQSSHRPQCFQPYNQQILLRLTRTFAKKECMEKTHTQICYLLISFLTYVLMVIIGYSVATHV